MPNKLMVTRPVRKPRTKLLLGILACLIAGGYVTYRWTKQRQTAPANLTLAKEAYDKGTAALAAGDHAGAIVQFDDSGRLITLAFAALDAKKPTAEERTRLRGELYWLKARTTRDRAFAMAAQDGTPIAEAIDTTSGEKFRSYTTIPEPARSEAIAAIRIASDSIADSEPLILDAMRIELMVRPQFWARIEKLCAKSLKFRPDDARSLFFMARYEFDQPGTEPDAPPLPPESRDAARVERAREYLTAAKAAGAPYWRAVQLEAEILNWQSRDARKRDPVKANAYRDQFRTLIAEKPNGALEKATRGDAWTNLSAYDIRGIAAVPVFAVDLAGDDVVKLRTAVIAALAIFDRLAHGEGTAAYLPDAVEGAVEALYQASTMLSKRDAVWWAATLNDAVALMEKHRLAFCRPSASLRLAQLYAQLPGDKEPNRAADDRTKQLLVRSIADAALRTLPVQQIELRAALLDTLVLSDAPAADIEAQLVPLRGIDDSRAKELVQFHEGISAERGGMAQAAKKKLEPLMDLKTRSEIAARAAAVLARIAFDGGDYNSGLGYLREVEAAFTKEEGVSPWDAAWLKLYAGSAEEVALRQMVAICELGRTRAFHWQRANPGKAVPDEFRTQGEQSVSPYLRKLQPSSDSERIARIAWIRFLGAVGQPTLAEKQLAMLTADFPGSVDVLRAFANANAVPKPGESEPDAVATATVDAAIANFIRANPASIGAKHFQLEWLLTTNRRANALAYLRSPANFAATEPLLEAAVSGSILGTDGLDDVSTILSTLPSDPDIAATIIAATAQAPVESLAFRRNEAEHKRRLVAAWRQLYDGQYESAAEGFLGLLDTAALRPAARVGLARSLLQLAHNESERAAPFLAKLMAKQPEGQSSYLAAALVAIRNDDIGEAHDSWGNSKSMYAALNRWQQYAVAYGLPNLLAQAMKSQFLLLAGRFQSALQETKQYSQSKKIVPELQLVLCQLHLDGPYRDLDAARKDLAKAFADIPDDATRFHRLEARMLLESGDADAARKICDLAVENDPQSSAAFAQLIEVATAQKDSAAAMQTAFRWHREQPVNPQAAAALIRQLYLNGAGDAAPSIAERFVRKIDGDRKTLNIFARLAVGEAFLGHADAEAERWIRAALEINPASAEGQRLAGMFAERRKEWDAALRHYNAAMEARPHDFASAARSMRVYTAEKKDATSACSVAARVREIAGTSRIFAAERLPPDFLSAWGQAALASNDHSHIGQARDGLLLGVRNHPGDPRLLVVLAELQSALGEGSRAAESLATALRIASDGNSFLSPQDRRDALERVEAARKKIRE